MEIVYEFYNHKFVVYDKNGKFMFSSHDVKECFAYMIMYEVFIERV